MSGTLEEKMKEQLLQRSRELVNAVLKNEVTAEEKEQRMAVILKEADEAGCGEEVWNYIQILAMK